MNQPVRTFDTAIDCARARRRVLRDLDLTNRYVEYFYARPFWRVGWWKKPPPAKLRRLPTHKNYIDHYALE